MSNSSIKVAPFGRRTAQKRAASELGRQPTKLRLASDLLHTSYCCVCIGVEAWET